MEAEKHKVSLSHDGDFNLAYQDAIAASHGSETEPELHWRTWLVLFACSCIWFGINYGISSTGFWLVPALTKLGGTVPGTGLWFAEGGLVTQVALTPIFGLISDFSPTIRKWTTIGLTLVGSVGLFVAGSADHLNPQGIVGVCFYGMSLIAYGPAAAIVADVFPRRMRGVAQGILYACGIGVSGFIADVGGGGLIKHVSNNNGWRWNLYMAAIFELIGCGLLALFYRPLIIKRQEHEPTHWERLSCFDWIGSALFCAAIVPLMIALVWGNSTFPWNSPQCIATITIGCGFLVIFAVHQVFLKKDGVFNHALFRNRNFALSLMAIFIEGVTYITLNTYLAQQVGTLYTSDPVLLGLHFGVLLICSAVGCVGWGLYSKRFREVKVPLIWGYVGFTAAAAGFSQLRPFSQSNAAAAWGLSALVGFSFGGPQGLILTVTQLSVTPELTGIATSLNMAIRSLGGAFGLAIANAIFSTKITTFLPAYIAQYAIEAGVTPEQLPAVIGAVATGGAKVTPLPGITPAQLQAAITGYLEAFADAYAYIYYSIIPWTATAAILLFALRSVKEEMTWHIDRPVEKELVEDPRQLQQV